MFLCKKINFYFSAILIVSVSVACYAMERDATNKTEVISTLHKKLLSCLRLQEDVAGRIAPYFFTAHYAYGKQLQILALVNKCNGGLVSAIPKDIPAMQQFIKDASDHFECSNEKMAEGLPWQAARKIVKIQNGVWRLCHYPVNVYYKGKLDELANAHMLERCCQEGGAVLDFSHGLMHMTPFMALCTSPSRCENDDSIRQLKSFFIDQHKKGLVDLNKVNAEGKNGFMLSFLRNATCWVMESFFIGFCFDDKTLKPFKGVKFDINLIKINHKDNDGNTALHLYFKGDWHVKNEHIASFIAAGADPEIKNNAGITPLERLKQLVQEFGEKSSFKYAYDYLEQIIASKKNEVISC